jgi:hypothetical protein
MTRQGTRSAATARKYTFDVMNPPSRAPRVAYHDAHLGEHRREPVPEAKCQAIPLEAFGPVASLARQRYFTHDNGGRPYLVLVDAASRRATVRRNLTPGVLSDDEEHYIVTYDRLVKRIDYVRFWNGYAPSNNTVDYDGAIGNTLLFETMHAGRRRYLLIAGQVFAFELPAGHPPIEHFSAPLGNNDVPYPYAWSGRYAYFLTPDLPFPCTGLENVAPHVKTGDLASFFYGQRDWKTGAFTHDMKKKQRAALVAMPQETIPARVIHSKSAE